MSIPESSGLMHGNTLRLFPRHLDYSIDVKRLLPENTALLPASLWSAELGSIKGHIGQHCPLMYRGSLQSGWRHTVARHSGVPLRQTQTVQSFGSQDSASP